MKMLLLTASVLTCLLLTSCGESKPSDTDVTSSEVNAFMAQAQAADPYMQQFTSTDDFKMVDEAVCDSFDGDQSYELVSKTVAAYIRAEPSDEVVDTVIRVAVGTSCPTMRNDAQGIS